MHFAKGIDAFETKESDGFVEHLSKAVRDYRGFWIAQI